MCLHEALKAALLIFCHGPLELLKPTCSEKLCHNAESNHAELAPRGPHRLEDLEDREDWEELGDWRNWDDWEVSGD